MPFCDMITSGLKKIAKCTSTH